MSEKRRTLGNYELLEPLGRGSVMQAYRAKSFGVEGFEKTLVVKELLPELASIPGFLQVFIEHVQRAMRLSHANLSQIFDLGQSEGPHGPTVFLATEHVSGLDVGTLLTRFRSSGAALPVPLAVYVALELCKALDHAHRRRDAQLRPLAVVHGAVAPHNVLVSFDGDVKLTDFGVTRAALSLPPRDTLRRAHAAASPELSTLGPTPGGDVFSVGSFLYHVLAGRPPFLALSVADTRAAVERGDVAPIRSVRADVPEHLAESVRRAMARHPDERHATVSALHDELLAGTFATGLRFSAAELADVMERFREPVSAKHTEAIPTALARPLATMPPPSIPPESRDSLHSLPPVSGFGDLRHVSLLVLRIDPPAPLPEPLADRARATVERYGGTVVSAAAGEMIAVFGADKSDGRDLELAVRCGLVLSRGLDVGGFRPSVGVEVGRLRFDGSLAVVRDERVERLEGLARELASEAAGAVVVSRRSTRLLRGRFPLEPFGRGYRVVEFAQDRFPDAFVGRRAELASLAESFVRAARGELRVISVVGEPGIGKTRIAVEMQRRLSRGSVELQTFFATCPPRGRELPGSGLLAMLRRVTGVRDGDPPERIQALEPRLRALGMDADELHAVLSGLGAGGTGRPAPAPALHGAFLRMMHGLSADRFCVFFWDDAHELDASSAELLSRAATRFAQSRIAMVFVSRPDPSAPVRAIRPHTELRLGPMTPEDVARLVADRTRVASPPEALLSFLAERAGGQPMFVEELLRQLEESELLVVEDGQVTRLSLDEGVAVPRTLRALTAQRLLRLSEAEKQLFVAAAVLEPPRETAVIAAMLGLAVPAVEALAESLIARGLLARESSETFGFPSPLTREVVLSELDQGDYSNLHRRAAGALRAALPAGAHGEADRVGYHLAAAGDRDLAADCYAESGLYYLAREKLDRAAMDLGYALELAELEKRPLAQIENWLHALSTAIRYVRTGPGLLALIHRLTERAERAGPETDLRVRMSIDLGSMLGALGEELAGEALLERSTQAARQNDETATALLVAFAELAAGRGDFRLAKRALDPLLGRKNLDAPSRHRVLLASARSLAASGRASEAEAALGEAARVVGPDNPLLSLDRAVVRAAVLGHAARHREAAEAAALAAAQAEELGLYHEVASSLADRAVLLSRAADPSRARAVASSALSIAEQLGATRVTIRARCALALDPSGTPEAVARADIAHAESQGWIVDALMGRLFVAQRRARTGAVEEARRDLVLAARIAGSTGNLALSDQLAAELAQLD